MTRIPKSFSPYLCATDSEGELEQISSGLRTAVKNRELLLTYQPKLDLKSGQIAGVEALLRWQHPRLGMLEPRRFISIAEQTGFIAELDSWALDEACRQAAVWKKHGEFLGSVAVNVCALDLSQSRFVEVVHRTLGRHGMRPEQLVLEITESCAMANPALTLATLHDLVETGVKVALDDFGIGHSSLSHLKRLPIHEIKVDGSFIRDIEVSVEDAAIVAAIVTIAEAVGAGVVAEGVETTGQLAVLMRLGCPVIQGYLVGRPMFPSEFVRSLKEFETISAG